MLISELKSWQWAITWDNPQPKDSSAMLRELKKIGRVTKVDTKTTVMFAPKANTDWRQTRKVLVANLHPKKGNVFYVNLRSRKAFQWGKKTKHLWKRV